MRLTKKQAVALGDRLLPAGQAVPKPGKLKYGNVRHRAGGYTWDSGLERDLYLVLQLMLSGNLIADLIVKPKVEIVEGFTWRPDFQSFDMKLQCVRTDEAKGAVTQRFRDAARLWKVHGSGPLFIWKSSRKGPRISETIYPKGWGK